MHTSQKLLKEVRIVPEDADDTNSFRIYGDVTEVVSFDDDNEYIIITISDKFIRSEVIK